MAFELVITGSTSLTTHKDEHDFYYRNECTVCPLRREPSIKPHGSTKPVVYILGEAAGRDEIKEGRPFVGVSGQMLRQHIPKDWNDDRLLRWNNCVLARPPDNRTPTAEELASCRPLLENDIVATKPKAIFGFGAVPLGWAGLAGSGITVWAGRRAPIRVHNKAGDVHTCWYFPMMHPSYVSRKINEVRNPESRLGYTSEVEFAFHMHLKQAFALLDDDALGEPVVHDREMAMEGIEYVQGCSDADLQRVLAFIDSMYDEPVVGFDYETDNLRPYPKRPHSAKVLTASMSGAQGTLAWPLQHREAGWTPEQLETIEEAQAAFLRTYKGTIAVHNAAFEQEWSAVMYGLGTIRGGNWACTMSQAYVLDERPSSSGSFGPQSLEWLCRQHFGFSIKDLNPVNRGKLDETALTQVLPYNGCDAKYHRLLYHAQQEVIEQQKLDGVFHDHMRRVSAAVLTQIKGLPVDHTVSYALEAKYLNRREEASLKLQATKAAGDYYTSRGRDLKPAAPADVAYLIERILPKAAVRKVLNEDGRVGNATEATLKLVEHEVVEHILNWRKANKALSTYITPVLPNSPHYYDDGLLHPQTRTTTVVTWRTSSDNPNYQNWPKRDDVRKEVRAQIRRLAAKKLGKKYKVVSFDYAGIQARNVAMESQDPELVKAFRDRYDIHSDWCEQIVRLAPRWVKEGPKALAKDKKLFKAYRNEAKNKFVFPSFFGARPGTVGHYLGLDDDLGQRLQNLFWGRFSGVKDWHEELLRLYRRLGYVTGLSGFRRRAPVAPNELINSPIQADEACIVLDAMARLSEMEVWALQPNMEIHDDLTFIWREDEVEQHACTVIGTMLNTPYEWAHIVPLGVEYSVGDDWHIQQAKGEYFTDTWKGQL